ncbi:hypothetical protein OE88DRAFT_1666863, partial [Heliocybe sulcata]
MAYSRIQQNYFICIIVEGILFVAYLLSFCWTLVVTCRRARRSALHARLAALLIFLFVATTVNFVIDIYLTARFDLSDAFYETTLHAWHEKNVYNVINVVHNAIFGLSIFVADALLVWRFYVFMDRKRWVIAVPIFVLLLEISFGITVIVFTARRSAVQKATPWTDPLPPEYATLTATFNWLNIAYYAMTFVINFFLCIAISWRIWRMLQAISALSVRPPTRYYRMAHILLESGMIYSVLIAVNMGLSVVPYNTLFGDLVYMFLDLSIGMVPTVVILLITMGKTAEYTSTESSGTLTALNTAIHFAPGQRPSPRTPSDDGPPRVDIELDILHGHHDPASRDGLIGRGDKPGVTVLRESIV